MRRGFTLIEVVVALLVLEVAVLGVLGALVVASRTAGRAERVERATDRVEAVLDSLRQGGAVVGSDSTAWAGGVVRWSADADGRLELVATGPDGELMRVVATLHAR
jgi:type II secretory pathway pseudopilin PulG